MEVAPLSSLMGVGSVGRMIFPKDSRYKAWIGAPDAAVGEPTLPARKMDSLIQEVGRAKILPNMQLTLIHMAQKAESSLMTAMVGPPGTGKTSHIATWLQVLLQAHNTQTPCGNLRIFVCAPTNHAVMELELMVERLTKDWKFQPIRIIKGPPATAKGKGKEPPATAKGK